MRKSFPAPSNQAGFSKASCPVCDPATWPNTREPNRLVATASAEIDATANTALTEIPVFMFHLTTEHNYAEGCEVRSSGRYYQRDVFGLQ
jgi:hypothetical protein